MITLNQCIFTYSEGYKLYKFIYGLPWRFHDKISLYYETIVNIRDYVPICKKSKSKGVNRVIPLLSGRRITRALSVAPDHALLGNNIIHGDVELVTGYLPESLAGESEPYLDDSGMP
jgi:hypothetical protein